MDDFMKRSDNLKSETTFTSDVETYLPSTQGRDISKKINYQKVTSYTVHYPRSNSHVIVRKNGKIVFEGTSEEYERKFGRSLDNEINQIISTMDFSSMDDLFENFYDSDIQMRSNNIKSDSNSGCLGCLLTTILFLVIFGAGIYFLGAQIIEFLKGLF